MHFIVILLLIVAVLLVIFTLQNTTDVTLHFFLWDITDAPLVLVLLSCLVLGYLLAAFYFYPRIWKLKSENKKLSRFNQELVSLQDDEAEECEEQTEEEIELEHPEGEKMDDDDDISFFRS